MTWMKKALTDVSAIRSIRTAFKSIAATAIICQRLLAHAGISDKEKPAGAKKITPKLRGT